jgi:hypothetical protein
MTHKLAPHRRVSVLAVALFVLAALGVSVGVAEAGTSAQNHAAATGNRVISSVAATQTRPVLPSRSIIGVRPTPGR